MAVAGGTDDAAAENNDDAEEAEGDDAAPHEELADDEGFEDCIDDAWDEINAASTMISAAPRTRRSPA